MALTKKKDKKFLSPEQMEVLKRINTSKSNMNSLFATIGWMNLDIQAQEMQKSVKEKELENETAELTLAQSELNLSILGTHGAITYDDLTGEIID